jgi:putative flavoprotein involved in K+ transport
MTGQQHDGSITGHAGAAEQVDTVIIGAGQAGLAAGYYLRRLGQSLVILDEHERTDDLWRERYSSLRLYSPAKYDGLPGMKFPAPPYSFPSGAELGDYLERYAQRMQLPVRTGIRADGIWPAGRGQPGYLVTAGPRRFEAAQVIVASGGQQNPSVPRFASELDPGIRQLHSSEYRDPGQLQPGPVLVVGASHSGADIALEVSAGHRTWLAGRVRGQLPFDLEGRPARQIMKLMWFAANHVLTMSTPLGRRVRPEIREHGGPLLRVRLPELHDAGVQYESSRVALVSGGQPVLEDGRILHVANVLWCTGFRPDFSWIHLPVTGPDGWPQQNRGVVGSAPGLYFLGLLFQYAFGSMLVGGVGRDAKYVARHIATRQPWAAPAAPAPAEAVPAPATAGDQQPG